MVVAGGLGIAPTAPLIEQAMREGIEVDLVLGARSASELVFEKRCSDAGASVHITTDDGSKGFKGFTTDLARDLLARSIYDQVYTCGPEPMIAALLKICAEKEIPLQASIERLMKCGIGICDSCAIDGLHVCTDGPVFSSDILRGLPQLGKAKHDRCGREVPI
jgi:dihydroorotate dehydrogenase electron transfer subunit